MAVEVDPSEVPVEAMEPSRHGWVLAAVVVACTTPLVAAVVGLAQDGWFPAGEFAQAELRVRDFWAHPPTLGAIGRLRTSTDVSSHPGPAAWWAMYPVYGLLGRSAMALSAAVAATAAAWIAGAVALAWRKGGDALAVILGLGVLAVMAALGPVTFVEPWNPWFAVMPFMCMVIAVWMVADAGPWALVVVAAAGSYCVQAHLGYAPLVAALGATALVGMWWSGPRRGGGWRPLVAPTAVAAGVAALMWLPPLVQQITGDPGNLGVMLQAYREETGRESALGLGGAMKLVGSYLNVRGPSLVLEDLRPTERSPDVGTLVVLAAWALSAGAAWRGRARPRMRSAGLLSVVVLVGMLSALVAASRIPGDVFGYLILWLGILVVLVAVAVTWTAWLVLLERLAPAPKPWATPLKVLAAGSFALLGVATALLVVDFSDPPVPAEQLSVVSGELIEPLVDELGDEGPYLIRWDDPVAFGGIGTAMLSELERRGFDVGVDDHLRVEMRPHRVLGQTEAEGAVWVVSGSAIEQWRRLPEARELAYSDPRTAATRTRFDRLRTQVRAELETLGGPELADALDQNYWVVRTDERVGPDLRDRIDELSALGLPTAVFLAPPETEQPPRQ